MHNFRYEPDDQVNSDCFNSSDAGMLQRPAGTDPDPDCKRQGGRPEYRGSPSRGHSATDIPGIF